MAQMRLLMKPQDLQKYATKIPGRNLSTHVDNVIPEKKIVNIMYNNLNPIAVAPNQNNMVPNNLNLSNNNSSNLMLTPNQSSQIIIGEINPMANVQAQNDPNTTTNYNMMNNQNNK